MTTGETGTATGRTETAVTPPPAWRPPLLWRFVLRLASVVVPLVCRLRITTSEQLDTRQLRGPLILAGNHIANFDPVATTAACARIRIAPRMMATGGLFRVPVIGALMRAAGHIPVDRGHETVRNAVPDAVAALAAGAIVFVYPEGRIGLHPAMWPERPRTGTGRLALATGAPVVPVAIWGSHEVLAYHGWPVMVRMLISALWRRPVVRVHFGAPVDLRDLRAGEVGHAQRASDRIMDAITADLARLRAHEPGLPRFRDHTRPVTLARARNRRT
ncbi:MAG: 1-acyl-sn-glycerol-3-phosphate acyltransferase [Chloroflexi bacterium]|nr:1-acyl-sn-glycerol-3-phosphate acyltransferase [Chloroflexota bacterium]